MINLSKQGSKAVNQKIIVFEANEIPLRVFKYYQSIKPNSSILEIVGRKWF